MLKTGLKFVIAVSLIIGLVGCDDKRPTCFENKIVIIKLTGEKGMLTGGGLGKGCYVRLKTMETVNLIPFEYEIAN
jgi:hypothetical protein